VDLRGARCDLGLGEPAHRVTQRVDVLAKRESAHAVLPCGIGFTCYIGDVGCAGPCTTLGSLPRTAGEGWGGGRQVAAVVTTRAFGARPPSQPSTRKGRNAPQAGGRSKAQRRQTLTSSQAGGEEQGG